MFGGDDIFFRSYQTNHAISRITNAVGFHFLLLANWNYCTNVDRVQKQDAWGTWLCWCWSKLRELLPKYLCDCEEKKLRNNPDAKKNLNMKKINSSNSSFVADNKSKFIFLLWWNSFFSFFKPWASFYLLQPKMWIPNESTKNQFYTKYIKKVRYFCSLQWINIYPIGTRWNTLCTICKNSVSHQIYVDFASTRDDF